MASNDVQDKDMAGQGLEDIQIRDKNRVKKASEEVKKVVKVITSILKKQVIVGILIAAIIIIFIIFFTAGLKFIKEELTKEDTKDKSNLPGVTKNVMMGQNTDTLDSEKTENQKPVENNGNNGENNNSAGNNGNNSSGNKAEDKDKKDENKITSLDGFLFIGDSRYSTVKSSIEKIGNNIKNVGVGSSNINEWISVVENKGKGTVQKQSVDISGKYPGISIQLGANGVYKNVNNTVNQMKTLITKLTQLFPNTPIFVNSCVQVSPKASDSGYTWDASIFRSNVDSFNQEIEEFCNRIDNVYYVDINSNLNDDKGYLKGEYTDDGLHCNVSGAPVFAKSVKDGILGKPVSTDNKNNINFVSMADSVVKSKNKNGEYCIVTDLDAKIEQIYKTLKDNDSGSIRYFKNEEEMKQALRLWIMAEYSTQYVNLSSNVKNYKYDYEADYIQGIAKVKRYEVGNEQGKFLTYIEMEKFKELELSYEIKGDTKVFNYFTIDAEENLVIAKGTTENQKSVWTGVEDPNGELDENFTKHNISEQKLNYRSLLKEYSLPFNLLWSLVVYSNDVSFSNELAKLVIDSEIIIGIRDNITTTVTTTTDRYLKEEKLEENVNIAVSTINLSLNITPGDAKSFFEYYIQPTDGSKPRRTSEGVSNDFSDSELSNISDSLFYEKTTTNTVVSDNVFMEVEYIDSWYAKYEMKYNVSNAPAPQIPSSNNSIPNTSYKMFEESQVQAANASSDGYDAVDAIINADKYAPDMYKKLKKQIIDNANTREQILKAAITDDIQSILSSKGEPYYSIIWNGGNIVNEVISGTAYRNFNDLVLNNKYKKDEKEKIKQNCRAIYYSIFSTYNQDKLAQILDENVRATKIQIKKDKYVKTINRVVSVNYNVDTKQFDKEPPKVTEKTQKEVKNGETASFVSILCKNEHKIVYNFFKGSMANWFFSALENNQDAQVFIDLIKYLAYKATDVDLGVKEYTFEAKTSSEMNKVIGSYGGSDILTLFTQAWEGTVTDDNGNYVIHRASTDPTIGYGIYLYYNLEAFQKAGFFKGVTISQWQNELYNKRKSQQGQQLCDIDGTVLTNADIDKVKAIVLESHKNSVKKYLQNNGITGLEDYQINALVQVHYQNGNIGGLTSYYPNNMEGFFLNWWGDGQIDRRQACLDLWKTGIYKDKNGQEIIPNASTDGSYTTNGANNIMGTFTRSDGKTYTMYKQWEIPSWHDKCNQAVAASILSGYEDAMYLKGNTTVLDNVFVGAERTKSIFNKYGLEPTQSWNYDPSTALQVVNSGGYVALHFETTGRTLLGKSGTKYSSGGMHWIGIIGYREENGKKQIMISNSGWNESSGWVGIDDFEAYYGNINNVWYITESL